MKKVGQIRSSQITLTDAQAAQTTLSSGQLSNQILDKIRFSDPYLSLESGTFEKGVPYYIDLSISFDFTNTNFINYPIDNYKKDISISLILQSEDGSESKNIKNIFISKDKFCSGDEVLNNGFSYQIAFVPDLNSYKYLKIKINRSSSDFYPNVITEDNVTFGRLFLASGKTRKMIDIFKEYNPNNIQYFTRVGIQGRPGLCFIVNDESIILGRTGIYEVNNELIKIKNLNFAPTGLTGKNSFIIDYVYND